MNLGYLEIFKIFRRISLFLIVASKFLIIILSVLYRVVFSGMFIVFDVVICLITPLAIVSSTAEIWTFNTINIKKDA